MMVAISAGVALENFALHLRLPGVERIISCGASRHEQAAKPTIAASVRRRISVLLASWMHLVHPDPCVVAANRVMTQGLRTCTFRRVRLRGRGRGKPCEKPPAAKENEIATEIDTVLKPPRSDNIACGADGH